VSSPAREGAGHPTANHSFVRSSSSLFRRAHAGLIASIAACFVVAGVILAPAANASDPSNGPLRCSGDLSGTQPVLLVHGTGVTATENWSWNYAADLPTRLRPGQARFSVCTLQLPDRALNDIQASAEYVVSAVRAMHGASGTKVSIIGHSQGGLVPRWALRWWPDLRPMVDDVITLATPHHGTVIADSTGVYSCEACWQMRTASDFITTLNTWDETPGDISYTSIYTRFDELVVPAESAVLDKGVTPSNSFSIAVQDVNVACSARPTDHLGMAGDAVAHALVLGALNNRRTGSHNGTAAGVVVGADTCARASFSSMPPPSQWPTTMSAWMANLSTFPQNGRPATSEPPLAPYVRETTVSVSAPSRATATDAIAVAATVADRGGQPLERVRVSFELGDGRADGITGVDGVARTSVVADVDAGTRSVVARHAGGDRHDPAVGAAAVEVARETTIVEYTGPTTARGSAVAVAAWLVDDDGSPVVGRAITFSSLGAATTVLTDEAGVARGTLIVSDHGSAARITTSFGGDGRYAPAATESVVRWGRG
jgi:triacylglycerol lipase